MTSNNAKIVRFKETGNASVLEITQEPIQTPGNDEIRLKTEAIGLNRAEVMFRSGAYLDQPELPSKIGYEASGVVDAVGQNVTEFKIGDRVSTIPAFSMSKYGIYGEYPIVPATAVAKYPSNLTAEQGASIWMQYITAYGALIDISQLGKGQTIIITAASSSVGIAAIQIALSVGATVIATTRGKSKVQVLRDAGADHVIQTDHEDLAERVLAITNNVGVNLVFDPIGGPVLEQLAAATIQGGRIIEYGALDPRETPFPLFTALGKGLTFHGYTLFEITHDPLRLARAKRFVYDGLKSEKLVPVIDRVFTFDEVQEAHKYMESNQQIGKIVLKI